MVVGSSSDSCVASWGRERRNELPFIKKFAMHGRPNNNKGLERRIVNQTVASFPSRDSRGNGHLPAVPDSGPKSSVHFGRIA